MKIKELPKVDRPREKLTRYGPAKLSNSELLAILLRTGGKDLNVVELSRRLLGQYSGGKITEATVEELEKSYGLGTAKACEIVACFELGRRLLKGKKSALLLTPKAVWEELKDIRDNKKEHTVVFFLDARNQEIKREIISVGTLTNNLIHPREVFEPAIMHMAAQVVVAHNHPSGDPEPSEDDKLVTDKLFRAGEILGIELVDHVIVTPKKFVSMKERGLLKVK